MRQALTPMREPHRANAGKWSRSAWGRWTVQVFVRGLGRGGGVLGERLGGRGAGRRSRAGRRAWSVVGRGRAGRGRVGPAPGGRAAWSLVGLVGVKRLKAAGAGARSPGVVGAGVARVRGVGGRGGGVKRLKVTGSRVQGRRSRVGRGSVGRGSGERRAGRGSKRWGLAARARARVETVSRVRKLERETEGSNR